MSVLVLDVGAAGVTAAVVAGAGPVVAQAHAGVPLHRDVHGWQEQATDDLWRGVSGAGREVLDAAVVPPDRVVLTTDPVATVLWDRETLGSPRRAVLAAPADALPWVAAHEPHTWALLEEGTYAVGGLDSYLVARLTLGTWHVTDATQAAATGLLDAAGTTWSAPACASVGVPLEALPELVTTFRGVSTEPRALHGLAVPLAVLAHDPTTPSEERVRAAAADVRTA